MNSKFTRAALTTLALSAFALAEESPIRPAALHCEYLNDPRGVTAARPRLGWRVEAADSAERGVAQTAYQILVARDEANLARDAGDLWDSGRVDSSRVNQIEYGGPPLPAGGRACWKVRVWDNRGRPSRWSDTACWTVGLLTPADWGDARWIGDPAPPPPGFDALPALLLRKAFTLASSAPVRRAGVCVSALGLYELRLNGQRVGDHLLAPEWTDYHRRVQYQTLDVTALLRPGANALGLLLGDGWYAGKIGLTGIVPGGPPRAIYGRRPRALLLLTIEFADGSTQRIITDGSWHSTLDGPIRAADLLDGETWDARRELVGWDAAGFDASGWSAAGVFEAPDARLVSQPNEPIRVTREISAVAVHEISPGTHIFDFGQNLVGRCRLRTRGPAGATVTLRHAEVLNADGTLYTANLRGAAQTDRFILRGDAQPETFEPHFTYHGFRYVEVSGLGEPPAGDALLARVFHSAAPETGAFECSEPLLNRLWQNILWTQRANLHSTPTDCPQRDERCGWMGDILAFAPTACFNMNMAAFFTKWIPDTRDAQADDGRFADFSPQPFDPNARFSGAPAWADAGIFVPWTAYEYYGDRRLLAEQYDAARRWIEFVHAKNPELLWKNARGNDYGDWLNADTLRLSGWPQQGAEVPKEVFATAFFARSAELLSRMARVLDKPDDAQRYAELAERIRAAFVQAYVQPDGRIAGDTQAGYAIALQFDLLPEELRSAAASRMVERFAPYDGNISTGFHSTVPLMLQLSARGHNDHAYRLALNRRMPSWGYAIDQGATTIWERWDGYVAGRGFQDPGMNSFSHYAIGSVGEWLYRVVLGINLDPEAPGCERVIIRPQPGPGVDWARGSYESIRGRIDVHWRRTAETFTLSVSLPPNVSARVHVPASDARLVREGAQSAVDAPGVRLLHARESEAVFEIGSGRYEFAVSAER